MVLIVADAAAEWVSAVFTFLAVLTALWLQWGRVLLRRPKLEIHFDPELDQAPVVQPENGLYVSSWVRPRVTSKGGTWYRGRDSARDVEILLVRVESRHATDGSSREPGEDLLEGLPLKWSEVKSSKVDLPPGVSRRFDLVHVDNKRREDEEVSPLIFDVFPPPTARYHRLVRGEYEITLALTAPDTKAAYYTTAVKYDGKLRNRAKDMAAAHDSANAMGNALRATPMRRRRP